MNLNLNLNFKQILNETLKDGIKLSPLLALAGIAYIGIQNLGILYYTGLTAAQVRKVAQEVKIIQKWDGQKKRLELLPEIE